MAMPPKYEQQIIAELKSHPEGLTVTELEELIGCSRQQIHKVMNKGKLAADDRRRLPIEQVGRGVNGAYVFAWRGGVPTGDALVVPVGRRRDFPVSDEGLPRLGERLEVVGMAKVDGGITVEVEDEEGRRHTFHR